MHSTRPWMIKKSAVGFLTWAATSLTKQGEGNKRSQAAPTPCRLPPRDQIVHGVEIRHQPNCDPSDGRPGHKATGHKATGHKAAAHDATGHDATGHCRS